MNFGSFLSRVSKLRAPSPIRYLLRAPGMYKFAGGLPNSEGFPFESVQLNMKDGSKFMLDTADMNIALQYSNTEGIQSMVDWAMNHQALKHDPKYDEWDVTITTGSQDALSKAFEMLIEPFAGDTILVENPCYTGALAALYPLEPNMLTIPIDEHGIIPSELEKVIENHVNNPKSTPIKFLYVVPTGHNPSGATMTVERKKAVLALAKKYNFLILEDDPYFYLNLEHRVDGKPLDSEISFLSMDTEGRVLRFDSLSKVLSSGLRIGWCTGHKTLIERIHLHMQTNSLHTSALSQRVASKLLADVWGVEGLEKHVASVQDLYRKQRDMFVSCVEKHLKDYITYSVPTAGMFLWFKFNDIPDSKKFIEERTRQKKVLLVPGQAFHPYFEVGPYARASYSIETLENMEAACIALRECIEQELKERKTLTEGIDFVL